MNKILAVPVHVIDGEKEPAVLIEPPDELPQCPLVRIPRLNLCLRQRINEISDIAKKVIAGDVTCPMGRRFHIHSYDLMRESRIAR